MLANMREFEQAAYTLVDALRCRLDGETLDLVREFIDHGEEMLSVDTLSAALTEDQVPITPAERDTVRDLLTFFEVAIVQNEWYIKTFSFVFDRDGTLAALNVVGEP